MEFIMFNEGVQAVLPDQLHGVHWWHHHSGRYRHQECNFLRLRIRIYANVDPDTAKSHKYHTYQYIVNVNLSPA